MAKSPDPPALGVAPTRDGLLAATFSLTGCALAVVFIFVSPEGLHHFDDITHYLFARWAWTWPEYLVDHWGRPGFTIPYFPAAALGWTACKLLSALVSALTGWCAFRLAQHAGLARAWLVIPLIWLQPLFFHLAQTTLTETPLALYLSLALLLAVRGRWTWSSAVISAAFVTRHEAILFLPIWICFAWRTGVSWRRLWPILWAPIAVNAASIMLGMPTTIELYLTPKPSNQYGSDGWLTFFARGLHAWGPSVAVLAWVGLLRTASADFERISRRTSLFAEGETDAPTSSASHSSSEAPKQIGRAETMRFIATCAIAYFAAQSVIRALGLFNSGGYARFLVPISPFMAAFALSAWNWLTDANPIERRRATAAVAVVFAFHWLSLEWQLRHHAGIDIEFPMLHEALVALRVMTGGIILLAAIAIARPRPTWSRCLVPAAMGLVAALTAYVFVRPLAPPPEAPMITDMRNTLIARGLADRPIISAVTWVDYATNTSLPYRRRTTRERIDAAPAGVLVVWEEQFAGSPDHGISLESLREDSRFRLIYSSAAKPFRTEPYLFVFEKVADPSLKTTHPTP
ncbi:MAG: hypothetical protein KF841_11460 [Phycisphaerae bacterium]|nr:hypothetical protein [Phycisphaerae bacterium]